MRDGTAILFIKKIIIRLIDNCLDSCLRLLTKYVDSLFFFW